MKLKKSTAKKVAKHLQTFFSFILKGVCLLIPIAGTIVAAASAAWKGAKAAYNNSQTIRSVVDTVTDKVDNLVFEHGDTEAETNEQQLMNKEDFDAMLKPLTIDEGTQTPVLGEVGPIESPEHPPKMASVVFRNIENLVVTPLPNGDIQFTMTPTPVAAAA